MLRVLSLKSHLSEAHPLFSACCFQPIWAEWNFLSLSFGRIYFEFKGCWVVNFIFFQILIVKYVSKLCKTWADAAS